MRSRERGKVSGNKRSKKRDAYTTGRSGREKGRKGRISLNRETQTGKLIQRVQMYLGL